jgi:hypothetical protein
MTKPQNLEIRDVTCVGFSQATSEGMPNHSHHIFYSSHGQHGLSLALTAGLILWNRPKNDVDEENVLTCIQREQYLDG